MKLHCTLLFNFYFPYSLALIHLLTGIANGEDGSSVTTESLVLRHGYPFETHSVQTSDGYILNLHRIPYSSRVNTSSPRPVAILMHGLLSSSSDWVILGPGRALGYILSDAGFDVWMGNARGNRYSRYHIKLRPEKKHFWNFSWHEIGIFDLPATIDYALNRTGEDHVRYFAHSQGTTTFLLLNSLNLEFKNRIKSAHLLAPVAYMNHLKSPVALSLAPFLGIPHPFVEITGSKEVLPNTKLQELLGNTLCTSPLQFFCSATFFLIGGFDPKNVNTTMLPEILATSPGGSSINQIYHYLQEYNSGYFRQFDYGTHRNNLTYGSEEPPDYPLDNIHVPIFLYYSQNDLLSSDVDVQRLISELPNSILKGAYLVEYPKWNHFDYVWGIHANNQVYDVVMKDVASIQ